MRDHKTCIKCELYKPLSEFYSIRRRVPYGGGTYLTKHRGTCKTCYKAYNRRYYADNGRPPKQFKQLVYLNGEPLTLDEIESHDVLGPALADIRREYRSGQFRTGY